MIPGDFFPVCQAFALKKHVHFPREKNKPHVKIFHMKLDVLRQMFPNCDSTLTYLVPNAITSFVSSIIVRLGMLSQMVSKHKREEIFLGCGEVV